jgi:hypothetical protein
VPREGVYGEGAVLAVALAVPLNTFGIPPACLVSSLVMASPLGTLPEPLAFLFLLGPAEPEGET